MRAKALTERHLRDLCRTHVFVLPETGKGSIQDVLEQAFKGAPSFATKRLLRRGKTVHQPATVVDSLLQTIVDASIRDQEHVRQSNRHDLITNLILFLKEPCRRRIYRFDIKNFYESVDRDLILEDLRRENRIPATSIRILAGIFSYCQNQKVTGLPRGMSLCATLAERHLGPFDDAIRSEKEVFLYLRFVDDILLVTSGLEKPDHIDRVVTSTLAGLGLTLNRGKTKKCDLRKVSESFDYLGYRFSVSEPDTEKGALTLKVDIADKKVNRTKTMLIRALIAFNRDGDFAIFRDRVRFLTGNCIVSRKSASEALRAGVYYSYPHLSSPNRADGALARLDAFLKRIVISGRLGRTVLSKRLLDVDQKTQILKMSFRSGHVNKICTTFSAARLKTICTIWLHV